VLFEANDNSTGNLMATVDMARKYAGVSVVSMSWGGRESAGETGFDNYFTTPEGHGSVTFVASTGDIGSEIEYPAVSPNVLAVGGTSLGLYLGDASYARETAWAGNGGGFSTLEPTPAYQASVENTAYRSVPDVAYDADPATGVYIYNSNLSGWEAIGGTSAGAPQWAALIAIANQGRALKGKGPLAAAIQDLYYAGAADFHDITIGTNGYPATAGYDLATGLGSPIVNLLVPSLVAAEIIPPLVGSGTILNPPDLSFNWIQIGAQSPLAFSTGQATTDTAWRKLETSNDTIHVNSSGPSHATDPAIRHSVGDAALAGVMAAFPTTSNRANRTTFEVDSNLAFSVWLADDSDLRALRSFEAADGLLVALFDRCGTA
jgi:hypothetical protein